MSFLGPETWNKRWQDSNTPWDLKGATPALVAWAKDQNLKKTRILVPGCGRGHDAHFLSKHQAQITAVDFAPDALENAISQYPQSRVTWLLADVTAMTFETRFHRVWEYTCFCALSPDLRESYISRVHEVLEPGGFYWGMVFCKVPDPENGPPFQIDPDSFHKMLSKRLKVIEFEPGTNRSIRNRMGSEIWFLARK